VVLTGENGAGKTNLLEAVSLFAPGRGLRRAAIGELARLNGSAPWAVSAEMSTFHGIVTIGTGLQVKQGEAETLSRIVRIDGETAGGLGVLGDYVEVSWLTPAMDGLFTGPASDRRRFLDRYVAAFDPGFRKLQNLFERAMRQRNRLLETGQLKDTLFDSLELQMAEYGTALGAKRLEVLRRLDAVIQSRRRDSAMAFPWSTLRLEGTIENMLLEMPAIEVEDAYIAMLRDRRVRDRAARRTLEGPHRSDFIVGHGPKDISARYCSTGEQKSLLISLVLANVQLIKQIHDGIAPIVLLDEIAAHLDRDRRVALFDDILRLQAQAWMTGTDRTMFSSFGNRAQYLTVENGSISV